MAIMNSINVHYWTKYLRVSVYAMGCLTIGLALATYLTGASLPKLFNWLDQVFTPGFIVIYLALFSAALHGWWRMGRGDQQPFWQDLGFQAAGGIATLSLTFTLLGISLGIGSLSAQTISPDTIQDIISGLTRNFSMAFMTTVVGLPTSAILRAMISLKSSYQRVGKTTEWRLSHVS